jgi:hypothetical protein
MPKGHVGAKLPLEPWAAPATTTAGEASAPASTLARPRAHSSSASAGAHAHIPCAEAPLAASPLPPPPVSPSHDVASAEHDIAAIAEEDEGRNEGPGCAESDEDGAHATAPPADMSRSNSYSSAGSCAPSLCADTASCSCSEVSLPLSPEMRRVPFPVSLDDARAKPLPRLPPPCEEGEASEDEEEEEEDRRGLGALHPFFRAVSPHASLSLNLSLPVQDDDHDDAKHIAPPSPSPYLALPPDLALDFALAAPPSPRTRALSAPRGWLSKAWQRVRKSSGVYEHEHERERDASRPLGHGHGHGHGLSKTSVGTLVLGGVEEQGVPGDV